MGSRYRWSAVYCIGFKASARSETVPLGSGHGSRLLEVGWEFVSIPLALLGDEG